MSLRKLYFSLTPALRLLLRRLVYLPYDLVHRRDKLVPPAGLIFTGAGDFKAIGEKFFNMIKQECLLTPQSRILDVGSGIGRLARPFTGFLADGGVYHGFDVVSAGIRWCRTNYREFDNFHFHHADIKNSLYNLTAKSEALNFTFPFSNNMFDAALVISVFTHMQENGVKQYLHEVSRVLDQGKYCVCTFFIITAEREDYFANTSALSFKYRRGNFYLHDENVPDANIAFRFEPLLKMINAAGLSVVKFLEGWWCDTAEKHNRFDFQDVLILQKHN